jgi:hypothetical protein
MRRRASLRLFTQHEGQGNPKRVSLPEDVSLHRPPMPTLTSRSVLQ